jgi:hypothetical protein
MAISLQLLLLLSLLLCEPTESQNNVGGIGCYGNLNTIALREGLLDSSEILLAREYTLCSGLYTIGTLDYDYQLGNGQDMLSLRPNMHVKCGETGARDNSCLISGGDVQVDGTNLFTVGDGTLDNVTLEGLTFISAGRHMAWLNKPGSVLFKDCVFRVRLWKGFSTNRMLVVSASLTMYSPSNLTFTLAGQHGGSLPRAFGFL